MPLAALLSLPDVVHEVESIQKAVVDDGLSPGRF